VISVRPGRRARRWIALLGAALLAATSAVRDYAARRAARMKAEPDAGYTTEFFLITGLLVTLTVALVAVLGGKIWDFVNRIQL
jgi:hypothetical protein